MERTVRRRLVLAAIGAIALYALVAATGAASAHSPRPHPALSHWAFVSSSETPPTQAQCFSAGRRCFTPQGIESAYDIAPLYAQDLNGHGVTIAIVDSFGSDTIAHDLHVFDEQFGLPAMCGEQNVTCQPGMPKFRRLALQGTPATKAPPSKSKAPGQEDRTAWALEVSLDVERAHAVAPGANILLVTTPTAETLGIQGFPQMIAAEDYVVKHHLAQVISQSFGAAEESFASTQSLLRLRYAYRDAQQNGVTVLASSGDFGTANPKKEPVSKGGTTIPFPTVSWPASDPLVTGVGGTALCTDPNATGTDLRTVDSTDPPAACGADAGQAEVVWDEPSRGIATGGGFSHVFAKPAYQATLPAGSTAIGTKRGVPDVALQASPRTGALVYMTLPGASNGGLTCPGNPPSPCSTGWYDVGGTSASSPQWAGLVALADQLNGGGLGFIDPALYKIGADSTMYANDFYDVTVGSNQVDPSIPGFSASPGWDPATGLGTPNAASLVPDLVLASH